MIQPGPTGTTIDFDNFRAAEAKPIFNSKIIEIDLDVSKAVEGENIVIMIPNDKIITNPAVREIIKNID